MKSQNLFDTVKALESLGQPSNAGSLVGASQRFHCVACQKVKPLQEMKRIRSTGVVANVVDSICNSCWALNSEYIGSLARVVCATCRHTVSLLEPQKEKSGYEWKRGSYAHVAVCPVCATDKQLKFSPIAEKIAFYKAHGIPYE